jgi:hypothetical protein
VSLGLALLHTSSALRLHSRTISMLVCTDDSFRYDHKLHEASIELFSLNLWLPNSLQDFTKTDAGQATPSSPLLESPQLTQSLPATPRLTKFFNRDRELRSPTGERDYGLTIHDTRYQSVVRKKQKRKWRPNPYTCSSRCRDKRAVITEEMGA